MWGGRLCIWWWWCLSSSLCFANRDPYKTTSGGLSVVLRQRACLAIHCTELRCWDTGRREKHHPSICLSDNLRYNTTCVCCLVGAVNRGNRGDVWHCMYVLCLPLGVPPCC